MLTKEDLSHFNNISEDRKSKAPYNFVPLPVKIWTWDQYESESTKTVPWKTFNTYLDNGLTGEIEVTAEFKTPFFIGSGNKGDNDVYEPFMINNEPCIPGSSFRGMIRNIFEILTFSKITPVTSNRLFYRSFDGKYDTLGKHYGYEFQEVKNQNSKSKIGFGRFERKGNTGIIKPYLYRFIKHEDIKKASGFEDFNPEKVKKYWNFMEKEISVMMKNKNGEEGLVKGNLVLSGYISSKNSEIIFIKPSGKDDIFIPESILDNFESDDQLTKWQKEFFSKDHFSGTSERKRDGELADNDAVAFITKESLISEDNPNGLFFFGRARHFRLPYDLSPSEMTSNNEYIDQIDMTEGLFGMIFKDKSKDSIKSRLSFSDLRIAPNCKYSFETIKLKPLASPRPTTYQHYIVQKNDDRKQLRTYFKNHEAFIRGHKLYWHHWDENKGLEKAKGYDDNKDNIASKVKVVKTNSNDNEHFKGVIKFYNLRDFELGALLTAIELQENCAHKIGMGKPLGLGSVKLRVKNLKLLNPVIRYSSWINNSYNIINDEGRNDYKRIFRNLIYDYVKEDEYLLNNNGDLNSILRLDSFFKLMSWDNRPKTEATDYIGDYNAFKDRRVLPSVYSVKDWGIVEPFEVVRENLDKEPVLENTDNN